MKDRFDVAFACDTDHDRHGIVTRSAGLLNPESLPGGRDLVPVSATARAGARTPGVGKTLVSSSMIDRVAASLGRPLVEVPVGFKWFVDGLLDGSLGFGGEESAGASFLRRDGTVWTTDKDGIIMGLLAAEMLARTGKDPGADLPLRSPSASARRSTSASTRPPRPSRRPRCCACRRSRCRQGTGRRPDRGDADEGARQWRALRRAEGVHGARLVRRASFRHRGRVQDLRRELRRRGAPAAHPAGGARSGVAGHLGSLT